MRSTRPLHLDLIPPKFAVCPVHHHLNASACPMEGTERHAPMTSRLTPKSLRTSSACSHTFCSFSSSAKPLYHNGPAHHALSISQCLTIMKEDHEPTSP